MKKILFILSIFCLNLLAMPSCYEIYKIEKEKNIDKAIFVLVDETTLFSEPLKEQIISNSLSLIEAKNYIFVAKFSAFLDNKYNEVLFDFALDEKLSEDERYDLNKNTLAKIDKCLIDQINFVRKNVNTNINNGFLKKGENIAKSDIFYALKDFSNNSISIVNAKEKIIILASDMLENSAITSFYAKGGPRQINIKKEIKILQDNNLVANFDGAKIYIIGAGLTDSKKSYVNPKILNSLSEFWREYFELSNGELIEFGTPALKRKIK